MFLRVEHAYRPRRGDRSAPVRSLEDRALDPRTGEARQIGAEEFLLVFQDGREAQLTDVAFGFGSLWLTNKAGNSVSEFDPRRDRVVSQVTVGGAPIAIAVWGRTLWVANFDDDTVSRIELPEPGVNQPRTVETFPCRGRTG